MARKIDDLGRIVLPVELRRLHGIEPGDALEISVEGDSIMLRKLRSGCVFCGTSEGLTSFHDRPICTGCLNELAERPEARPRTPDA